MRVSTSTFYKVKCSSETLHLPENNGGEASKPFYLGKLVYGTARFTGNLIVIRMVLHVKDRHFFLLIGFVALSVIVLFVHLQLNQSRMNALRLLWSETALQLGRAIPEHQHLQGHRTNWLLRTRSELQRSKYLTLIFQEGGSFEVAGQVMAVSGMPTGIRQAAQRLETSIKKLRQQIDQKLAEKKATLSASELLAIDVFRRKVYQDLGVLEGEVSKFQKKVNNQGGFFATGAFVVALALLSLVAFLLHEYYFARIERLSKRLSSVERQHGSRGVSSLSALSGEVTILTDSIESASVFISHLAKGQYDQTIGKALEERKLGRSLVQLQQKLLGFSREEQQRLWKMSGLSRLSDLFSTLQNEGAEREEILYKFTKELCKHAGLNQGAIFLVEHAKNESWLALKACYAYEKRRFLDKKIKVNEGLLGQCVQEQQSLYFEGLPFGYVTVSSGLGEATPSYLFQSPLIKNNLTIGVIELASFKPFEPHVQEFIENAAEKLAITLSMVNMNEETKSLLLNSQEMNKQLRMKEEQMVAYNEQLSQEFEEINRKLKASQEKNNPTLILGDFKEEIEQLDAELSLKKNMIKVYQQENSNLKQQYQTVVHKHSKLAPRLFELEKKLRKAEKKSLEQEEIIAYLEGVSLKLEQENRLLASNLSSCEGKSSYLQGFSDVVFAALPICELDAEGNYLRATQEYAAAFNYSPEEMVGVNQTVFLSKDIEERSKFKLLWEELLKGETHKLSLKWIGKEGNILPVTQQFMATGPREAGASNTVLAVVIED